MLKNHNRSTFFVFFFLIYISFAISYGVYYVSIQYVDFPSFYYAANVVFKDNLSPYENQELSRAHPNTDQTIFPFLYPPPSLLTYYPLSLMSYQMAATMTLIANHFLLLFFIYFFFFKIMRWKLHQSFVFVAVAYVLLYHPVVVTLNRGQVNLFVLVLLCLTWYTLKQKYQPGIVALPLSLATLIKVYPAIFLFYLIAKRKYRVVLWVLGYLVLYTAIALLLLPNNLWSDWFTNVFPTGGYGKVPLNLFSPAAPWNQSINGFTSRLFLDNEFSETLIPSAAAARSVPYVISIFVVIITTGLCYLTSKASENERTIDLELSLFLLTMFLVAPISWEHHLVFVLPATIIALKLIFDTKDRYIYHLLVIFSALLLAWRLPLWAKILKIDILTLGISIKFYAVILIWAFFVLELWRYIMKNDPHSHTSTSRHNEPGFGQSTIAQS